MTHSAAPPRTGAGGHAPRLLSAKAAAAWSVGAHVFALWLVYAVTRLSLPAPLPPAYNVELVAAPAGPRALGAVSEGPSSKAPESAPVKPAPAVDTKSPVAPPKPIPEALPAKRKPAPSARPVAPAARPGGATAVPGRTPAGGGPTGGRGRDVANVKVQGIAFPYPGYLENITRQIALNFKPRPGVALKAEVTFLIHRDGSVSDLRLLSRSGVYAFDLECIGAVEAVGQRRSFGALPTGFRDDVLPVVFSFDPSVLR